MYSVKATAITVNKQKLKGKTKMKSRTIPESKSTNKIIVQPKPDIKLTAINLCYNLAHWVLLSIMRSIKVEPQYASHYRLGDNTDEPEVEFIKVDFLCTIYHYPVRTDFNQF